MDEFYSSSSDSDDEIAKSEKKDNSFEQEFEQLIEKKIRSDFKLEKNDQILNDKQEDFYDPNKDNEDEEFVQNLGRTNQSDDDAKVKSDATLNCPCCMSLLSLETQRHITFKNQYRAMFTFNCKIDKESPIRDRSNKPSKKRKRNNQNLAIDVDSTGEIFYRVLCSICSTEVGVYDNDQVYHFYNCIAGY